MPNNPQRETLTVSELNAYIKSKLEGDFLLSSLYLRAEISNFKVYPSGHCYFTLKDKDSMISAVMWASSTYKLSFRPKDGDEVLVHGRVAVYPPRGSYQLSVDHMELFGLGAELLRLEKLKAKLAAEGLFDPSRKRRLPKFPRRVGVIAGKGSAGLRDIVVNIYNRFPLVELVQFPSLVQGKEAPADLIAAFSRAQQANLDVLIIGRGGGSSEDLGAFNDEALVRALANSRCPVISAVGHEVDTTLTDLVADLRVSTPTGAAVAAVPDKNEIYQTLDDSLMRLENAISAKISRLSTQLGYLSGRSFFLRPESLYEDRIEKLQVTARRLDLGISAQINAKAEYLKRLKEKLFALNPYQVLNRGYSISVDDSGKVIDSVEAVKAGQRIYTRAKDGIIESEVTATRKGK
ncbi:MAG: exodeoxyribonuclease VII large subunit [Bacilli bacterium]|nr:exodeoxyribonuclease VII large subunit [Bacilli bacterium]